jgi:hypothetical protein
VTGGAAQALSVSCHYLHMGIMLFILLGWMFPVDSLLMVHLALVPSLLVIWYVNGCSCPLNNIESYLLKGMWRDPDNREEGSFLVVVVERYLGIQPAQRQMDLLTYLIMALAWVFSALHLWLRMEA